MSASGISFSLHEMMRTHGFPYCLIAGNRMTLSTQTMSGFTLASTSGRLFCAHTAVSTMASQQSFT